MRIPSLLLPAVLAGLLAPAALAGTSGEEAPVRETAIVEQVFKTTADGFSCIYYVITWRGQKTVVDDPLCSTDRKVGDTLDVLVMKHDMSDEKRSLKLLHLTVLPPRPAKR
ncbi:hypothetical protein [Mesoterricola sediminis]|uniref:DUF5666 domain-containing protein n=1 Tax=Mesoterricola sediminis TaxID=2927980 RepID=A0AA48GTF4_9BACT|nr:hypothetical protein [Mesoterricola sediminis]BDU77277.1 hypothetical protein METESE_22350 [Mesoterricola sediminis]